MFHDIKESLPEASTSATNSDNYNKNKKRKGKGAQRKSTDKFRQRAGEQVLKEFHRSIEEKYKLFDSDKDQKLEQVVSLVQLSVQPRAVPLSVTTRGVGFATAVAYQRSCTTWSWSAVSEIASVHVVYRVNLMLFHLKVYLAQQIQSEQLSFHMPFQRVFINDEMREQVMMVTQVPSVIAMVLDCVGKVTKDDKVWHTGYPSVTEIESEEEYRSLVITPDTIRRTLEFLSDAASDPEQRADFVRYNSIPGAQFNSHNVLTNADQIWPEEYTVVNLLDDIHRYKNWINRVSPRLPSHTFPNITWDGNGNLGALWSCDRIEAQLVSSFSHGIAVRSANGKTARTASGGRRSRITEVVHGATVTDCSWKSSRSEFWSVEQTSHASSVIGTASLVGEVCSMSSRHEINGHYYLSVNSLASIVSLSDAPR